MIKDRIGKIMGCVKYEAFDKDGKLIYSHKHDFPKEHNTVCDLYYDLIADHMAGGADTVISFGHCGTGTGQGAADTNLASHVDEARTAIDSSTQGAGADAHKVTVITTLGAGVCTAALTECGLFVAGAQATADMQLYDDSLVFTKGAGDTLVITWVITHSN